jgi:hypothetical protein
MSQVAPPWRKSSRCDHGACIEVAQQDGWVAVRDNTLPDPHLRFDHASWRVLMRDIRSGRI